MRVAIAYAVVAWLLIQIATQTFPFFEIPKDFDPLRNDSRFQKIVASVAPKSSSR